MGLFSHADGEGRRIRTCRPPDPKKAPEANIFVNYEVFGGPGSAGEPLGGLLVASWGPLGNLLGGLLGEGELGGLLEGSWKPLGALWGTPQEV